MSTKSLYLIKRGPRPSHHKAPFHPVVICDKKRVAEWEAGNTRAAAWVWEKDGWDDNHFGWLLVRWNGLDIDYSPVVALTVLPDGTKGAFWRDYPNSDGCVSELLDGAIWLSEHRLPSWLGGKGAVYPPDLFTQERLLDTIANDGHSGFNDRQTPKEWICWKCNGGLVYLACKDCQGKGYLYDESGHCDNCPACNQRGGKWECSECSTDQ